MQLIEMAFKDPTKIIVTNKSQVCASCNTRTVIFEQGALTSHSGYGILRNKVAEE